MIICAKAFKAFLFPFQPLFLSGLIGNEITRTEMDTVQNAAKAHSESHRYFQLKNWTERSSFFV